MLNYEMPLVRFCYKKNIATTPGIKNKTVAVEKKKWQQQEQKTEKCIKKSTTQLYFEV